MFVNVDPNTVIHPFLNRVCGKEHFCKDMLLPFVDQYADTEVTDLLFNIFCQYSATDSEVWGTYEEKYLQKEELGQKVDYTETFGGLYKMNRVYGVDPFEVWINRCREVGIRPWLSFRMNDAHNNEEAPYFAKTAFFYEAKAKGWTLGSGYGYYGYNFDYGVKEIRDRMLAYIAEQLDRYDVHGIELDYLREIICFKYHTADMEECTRIMNGFIADVKRIVKQAEDKRHHSILLAVRVMRDYEQSLRYGFDPTKWSADVLIPSPRWASSDSDIRPDIWKQLCPNAYILPCIETLFAVEPDHTGIMSAAVARGHAATYKALQAPDVYLYNYFSDPDTPYADDGNKTGHPYHRNVELYHSIDRYPKRFAVVGQSDEHYPDTFPTWRPLPSRSGELELVTGLIPKDRRTSLIIGVRGEISDTEVSVNGVVCRDFTPCDLTYIPGIGAQPDGYVAPDVKCYRCKISPHPRAQKIAFKGKAEVCHIEIAVC